MAYGLKYELFFSDIEERKLKIEILEKDFTGDPSPIIGTEQPAVIEWDADDDIYSPIIGSRCKLSFFVTNAVQYDEFYKSDERQYKVKILYYNSYGSNWEDEVGVWEGMDVIWNAEVGEAYYYQPIWEGFLVVDRFQEAIITPPYRLEVEAVDGLGTLDGFDAPINTTDTSNTENLFYYLKEILKLTGHQFDIYIANSIRKATSPPDDETIFHDIEINEYGLFNDNLTFRNAKDVLAGILKITNSRVFQSYGRWYIISNSNLIDNSVDTSDVIDNIAPSGADTTDAPEQPTPTPIYTAPNIEISGEAQMYEGTDYKLIVVNVGGTEPVSYTWTKPSAVEFTTDDPIFNLGVVTAGENGDTYSVVATDASGETDSDSFTLNVSADRPVITDPDPPQDETVDTNYEFVVNVINQVSDAYVSPLKGLIDYTAGEVGDAFTMQFNIVSLTGEFTSASQVTSETITSNTGSYTLTKTLVGDFVRVTVSGNLPSGGGNENLTLVGASNLQQFTTAFTLNSTVTNASNTPSPANLSQTGATGDAYSMTITYTPNADYEFTGLGNLQITSSADVGQTITSLFTSSELVITITGEQSIADQSATINVSGTPVFAAAATSITVSPNNVFAVSEAGGRFDVNITADGAFTIFSPNEWISFSVTEGAPDTTSVRVYFDRNLRTNTRTGNIYFRPRASLTNLDSITLTQESSIQTQ